MQAAFAGGTLRTKPLSWQGANLHVNAAVRFGRLEVALLDGDGRPLADAAVVIAGQDAVNIGVPLTQVAAAAGQPARLAFTLHNAQLFSFWVE